MAARRSRPAASARRAACSTRGGTAAPSPRAYDPVGSSARVSGSSVRHANELELLVMSLDHLLPDLSEAGDVVLLLGLGLERAVFARHQHVAAVGPIGNHRAPL